jgi:hypothetical protein
LSSYNKKQVKEKISPYPESNIGAPSSAKIPFSMDVPIVFSPHNPKKECMLPQVVHVTEDQGHSFEIISPDLSRNDPKLQEKQADQSQRIKLEQKYMLRYSPYQTPWKRGNLDRMMD